MRVSPSIVFVYGQGDLLVVGEVGVAEDEALDAREDAFNWVEPGCIGLGRFWYCRDFALYFHSSLFQQGECYFFLVYIFREKNLSSC